MSPILSHISARLKIDYFLRTIPRNARVLDIGCGSGWVGKWLKNHEIGCCSGLDLNAPADVIGDIRNWKQLGLEKESYDYIIAFEVVEHVDCFQECYELLKPGGQLLITTPLPHADWLLKILERLKVNQRRTSPHTNLVYLNNTSLFRKKIKIVGLMAQWAIFSK